MDGIRVAVAGASGRMGREVCRAVLDADGLELVAAVDIQHVDEPVAEIVGRPGCDLRIVRSLSTALDQTAPDVAVDFTQPYSRISNFRSAIAANARPVVGTTGWTPADLQEAERVAADAGLGAIIAPNFAIGAVLMMRFATIAARHLPNVEIIELHHDGKLDAPSGTANQTAQAIAEARRRAGVSPKAAEGAPDQPSRGLEAYGVPVHSVRLPGLVAHQEVIFGGLGQTLTIRHDSLNRESFMPGVILACRKVMELRGLVFGLDAILD